MVLNVHIENTRGEGGGEGDGREGGMEVGREGDYIPIARMTSALRWAAMTAILMFQ